MTLTVGELWIGGDRGTFALHSVAKAPIAWMALAAAEARGEPLTARLADQMRQMISWSSNTAVPPLLEYVGGLDVLREFYDSLHLESLVANFHDHSWGRGRGTPSDVAAAYGQMAASERFSPAVRERGLALLKGVATEQRWGATTAPLRGWRTLVKTGQFAVKGEGLRLNSAAIWAGRVGAATLCGGDHGREPAALGIDDGASNANRGGDRSRGWGA